ncbi:unnamed protein product [Leuciscus chuanchicus]
MAGSVTSSLSIVKLPAAHHCSLTSPARIRSPVTTLAFADDLVLIGGSWSNMTHNLLLLDEFCQNTYTKVPFPRKCCSYHNTDGYSWCPPYKDLERVLKSVRTMEEPQPEKGWTRHRTRILHGSASFQNVAKNWKKASYTSDINSEPEIARKRIPNKFSHKILSEENFEHEQLQAIKSVPPAPKPPPLPKRTQKKGPVVQTEAFQSKAVNPLSNLFVNQQQRETEEQQQTWCESLPSFQAPVCVSEAEHYGDGWSDDPPNTQEHTFSVLRTSGDNQGRTTAEHHGAGWGVDPPNAQARAILETLEKMDMKINHLTSLVQSLVGNRCILPQMQNDEEDDVFPIASIEDLDRLEQSEQIIHQWRAKNEEDRMENLLQGLHHERRPGTELVLERRQAGDKVIEHRLTLNRQVQMLYRYALDLMAGS